MSNKEVNNKKQENTFKDIVMGKLFRGKKMSIPQLFAGTTAFVTIPAIIGVLLYSKTLVGQPVETVIVKMLIAGAVPLVVALIATFFGLIQMNKDIVYLSDMMEEIKEKDLTKRIQPHMTEMNTEIGYMSAGINDVLIMLNDAVKSITENGSDLENISGDVLDAANDAKLRTEEISEAMNEIATDISEQAGYAEQNSVAITSLAKKLNGLKSNTEEISEAAINVSKENNQGLLNVRELEAYSIKNDESSKAMFQHINELISKINNIEGIVQTMSAIADQTNLLALNAAIEAARAGEMGAGFSVVAGEVKKLAEQSARHADSIRGIVSDIQKDVELSVEVMKESETIASEQSKAVENVVKSFNEISVATKSMETSIDNATILVKEIDEEKNQIVSNIGNTALVSQRSAAATEEITASLREQTDLAGLLVRAADSLSELSKEIDSKLGEFKI